jgi:hypothetical protein
MKMGKVGLVTASLLHVILLFTIAMLAVQPAAAQAATPLAPSTRIPVAGAPVPLIVLIEFDPWRPVIGSDSPSFALYDNGLLIFVRSNSAGKPEYASILLSQQELDTLIKAFEIGDDFYALESYYDLVLMTDQPTSTLIVWDAKHNVKSVTIYGDLRQSDEARKLTPAALLKIFDQLVTYENSDAKTWLPEKFEVMIWPYNSSDAVAWPSKWPDLNDPTTVKRSEVYSLYVDIKQLEAFHKLTRDASALKINNQTWAFSIRFPLPAEAAWKR